MNFKARKTWESDRVSLSQLLFIKGFPGGSAVKNLLQCKRPKFDPWVRKIPWRREWLHTPVFFPGKSHGQRSLAGYSSWGRKKSDRVEWLTLLRLKLLSSYSTSMWRGYHHKRSKQCDEEGFSQPVFSSCGSQRSVNQSGCLHMRWCYRKRARVVSGDEWTPLIWGSEGSVIMVRMIPECF